MTGLWIGFPMFYMRVAPHAMIVKFILKDFIINGNSYRYNKIIKIMN